MSGFKIIVRGLDEFQAEGGRKLVKVLEDAGIDVSHRCGGQARCTSCRVEFHSPEPPMDELERASLEEDGALGLFRLSCQIRVDRDMDLTVLMRVSTADWDNPGAEVDE